MSSEFKFACQDSCPGKCCTVSKGKHAFIFLTYMDRFKLGTFLNRPLTEFAKRSKFYCTRFTNKMGRFWYLKQTKEGSCIFLKEGKCSVYEARPTQCRTWPYWPENINKETWAALAEECPGINQGVEITSAEVQAIVQKQVKADAVIRNSPL